MTTHRDFIIGRPEPGEQVPVLDLTGPPPVLNPSDFRVKPPAVDVPLPFEDE